MGLVICACGQAEQIKPVYVHYCTSNSLLEVIYQLIYQLVTCQNKPQQSPQHISYLSHIFTA